MPKKKGSSSLKWRQIPKDKTFFPLFIDGTKKCKNTPKIIDAKLIREVTHQAFFCKFCQKELFLFYETISCPEYKVEFEKSLRAVIIIEILEMFVPILLSLSGVKIVTKILKHRLRLHSYKTKKK
jgi:hypothetical protein